MLNRTNEIIVLGNDEKYLILKQIIKDERIFYYSVKVSKDETTPLDEFYFFEDKKIDNLNVIEEVKDINILNKLNEEIQKNL